MAEGLPKEKWIQGVALTTTILAVCAAIGALRANSYSTKVGLYTTQEANGWAYFQAKNIREHSLKLQRDLFKLQSFADLKDPKAREFIQDRIKKYDEEVARYSQERAQIKTDTEKIQKDIILFKQHNATFALSVMLLQIAIMMSAVGALVKRKAMWLVGLAFGVVGLFLMANGFFLWIYLG
jgi:phage-related tail protein